MFFFVEQTPQTFVRDKTFQIKKSWSCIDEYRIVNKFCYGVRDRLNDVFQNKMGMKRAQIKTSALHALIKNLTLKKVKDNSMKKELMHNLLKKRLIN